MPKRSVAARSGAQRQKPRAQKSFELVRSDANEQDDEAEIGTVPAVQRVVTETVAPQPQESRQPVRTTKTTSAATVVSEPAVETKSEDTVPSKVSASTRMATRRQAAQRTQQRGSATLINAEHFAYVRRDLMIIATLAILMFAAIIVLYFVFGRGA